MLCNKPLTALVALATATQAAFTALDVVNNLQNVTMLSANTNNIAMTITPFNFFSTAPPTINNFRQIVNVVVADNSAMAGGPIGPFTFDDQTDICDAFRSFVIVHQRLLSTVIGKRGILASTPFTAPIAQVLRLIEGGVDTLAFGLIDLVPTCAIRATQDKDALDGTLNQAIRVYSF